MGKRLQESLSSQYFEAANKLNSKTARHRIVAYVESYDDVFFWRSVLSGLETPQVYFQVTLPSRSQKLERGKKAVLMNLLQERVGEDMIACVDADYDYLIQGATNTSKTILANPYIFHTYAYAIENLQCYAPSLHDLCVAITLNDHAIFDFEEYMRQFSQAIFPLFVWSIWHYRSPNYNKFTISNFLTVIELGNCSLAHANELMQRLRHKVARKVDMLKRQNPTARQSYQAVKEDLKRLGVTADTTYLYIQGHHLFDKVVVPIMNKVCSQLVKEREDEIRRDSMHGTQRRNELSCYSHSVTDITMMLKKGTGYTLSEPFRRIQADIADFLNKKFGDEKLSPPAESAG